MNQNILYIYEIKSKNLSFSKTYVKFDINLLWGNSKLSVLSILALTVTINHTKWINSEICTCAMPIHAWYTP